MTKIETIEQYEWAMDRIEQLLPLVDDNTPASNPCRIELELLSNLVADYSENTRDWYLFHMGQQIVLNDSLYEQIATIAEQDEMLSYNFFMCTGEPTLLCNFLK